MSTPDEPRVRIGLPTFRGLRADPLDPAATTIREPEEGPPVRAPERPLSGPETDQEPLTEGDGWNDPLPEELEPPDRPGSSRTSWVGKGHGSGSPTQVARVFAGLLAIALGTAAALLARRGRALRQPTADQVRDVTDPLGRLACRYLPMAAAGPTLVDVTQVAAAAHAYVLDGPMTTPLNAPTYAPEDNDS